ncbi:hypothetical protein PsorP6_012127 [Peronosclerospora sorghi]|uniref:Uncharacterized protein n=1 Tax=Peronosclerospora sorghi TaxID=230839 RepID=A0ACC0WMD7_9STRA|nr:hypothetical protein PsorP6_012127 [Peronosclerospora sorghi]
MQQVRVGRASQVPVPPSNNAPLDLSSDLRQQLRVTRHRAYERYQENAQWTKELLEGPKSLNGKLFSASIHAASVAELEKQDKAQKEAIEELERQLVQEKEAQEMTRRRFEELMTSLKSVEDAAALKECEEKVSSEKLLLLPSKTRKLEFVQL